MNPLTGNPTAAVDYARRANPDELLRVESRRRVRELRSAVRLRRNGGARLR